MCRLIWLLPLLCCSCLAYHMMRKQVGKIAATQEKAAVQGQQGVVGAGGVLQPEDGYAIDLGLLVDHLKAALEKFQVLELLANSLRSIADPEHKQEAVPTDLSTVAYFTEQLEKVERKYAAMEAALKAKAAGSNWLTGLISGLGSGGLAGVAAWLFGKKRGTTQTRSVLGSACDRLGATIKGLGGSKDLITGAYKDAGGDELVSQQKQRYGRDKEFLTQLADRVRAKNGKDKKASA